MTLWDVREGDALEVLRALPDGAFDAAVSDPPYPEIDRPYGRLSEDDWMALMQGVVTELRRVLTLRGSAVLILQPNSEVVGRMRPWLWKFLVWASETWGVVQDAYWWNIAAPPTIHCNRTRGLMRPSVKHCIWLGSPDCYRNQDAVLWEPSEAQKSVNLEDRALRHQPSGQSMRPGRLAATVQERGGCTPFNLLPIPNTISSNHSGHSAATPEALLSWWVRYLCPHGGSVIDPFSGSGTTGLVAVQLGRRYLGIERDHEYAESSRLRIARVDRFMARPTRPGTAFGPLFAPSAAPPIAEE